jgi:uncharacterized membrane protein YjgN (DUF898 family)
MESIVKSLEYVISLDLFQNRVKLNNYIEKHSDTLSKDEKDILYKLFDEIAIYKNRLDLSCITPSHLDEVLNTLKKNEITIEVKEETKKKELEFTNFNFEGKTGEYFKIWIVNIFLTLITFGLYSPWAKVRTNRYFYANTYLYDNSFEYTADPIKILKGRLIVVSFYLLFIASSRIFLNPLISVILLILAILITPWIITKAIKFKLKNTKYKNINFHYHGSSVKMYKFFLWHLILNIFTLYLAYPYSLNKFKELVINDSSYGKSYFSYDGKAKDMYINFLKIVGVYILSFVIIGFIGTSVGYTIKSMNLTNDYLVGKYINVFVINLLYIFILFGLKAFYDAIIQNYTWEHTKLSTYPFKSELSFLKLTIIYVTNILAIILSLGLLYPWTKIRTLKYKLENLYTTVDDEFITEAESAMDETSIGEEVDDFFDLDIGI